MMSVSCQKISCKYTTVDKPINKRTIGQVGVLVRNPTKPYEDTWKQVKCLPRLPAVRNTLTLFDRGM